MIEKGPSRAWAEIDVPQQDLGNEVKTGMDTRGRVSHLDSSGLVAGTEARLTDFYDFMGNTELRS